jgi:uncharacterized protein YpmB
MSGTTIAWIAGAGGVIVVGIIAAWILYRRQKTPTTKKAKKAKKVKKEKTDAKKRRAKSLLANAASST